MVRTRAGKRGQEQSVSTKGSKRGQEQRIGTQGSKRGKERLRSQFLGPAGDNDISKHCRLFSLPPATTDSLVEPSPTSGILHFVRRDACQSAEQRFLKCDESPVGVFCAAVGLGGALFGEMSPRRVSCRPDSRMLNLAPRLAR